MNSVKTITRLIINLTLNLFDKIMNNKVKNTFVLCYHSFSSDNWVHGVSTEELSKQLESLVKNFTPITGSKLVNSLIKANNPSALSSSFVMTIDDGYADTFLIKDITQRFNVKPILFLLSNPEKADRVELDNNKPFLTKSHIKQLSKLGWEFGSHSATHADFYKLTQSQIDYEVSKSKIKLEKELGIRIDYFAYPKGRYTSEVLKAVKRAGYKLAFTMDDGYITSSTDSLKLPRIGINRTHTLLEFNTLPSPSVMFIRGLLKKILLKKIS